MALIVTLGILTAVTIAVMAYLVSLRIERLAARNHLDRQVCREYVRVGVIHAMESIDPANSTDSPTLSVATMLRQLLYTNSPPPVVYPVDGWVSVADASPYADYFRGECMGSYCGTNQTDFLYLFSGSVTNLLPPRLRADARQIRSGWPMYVTGTNQNLASGGEAYPLDAAMNGTTNGRIAFLVINCSGFAPPSVLADELNPSPHFLSQAEVPGDSADDVFFVSYDPNPYQRYADRSRLGTPDAGVTNRFDVNSWTNAPDLTPWLANSALELAACGFSNAAPPAIAQNLLDFMDADRIPLVTCRSNRTERADLSDPINRPCRVDYGLEDLPMLNEVVLRQVADPAGGIAHEVHVEVWYPYVPALSPRHMVLWVGVYTNLPLPSATEACSPLQWPGTHGFTNELPQLYYPDRAFHVVKSPPSSRVRLLEGTNVVEVSPTHPIWIWPKLFVLDTNANAYVCTDEMLLTPGAATPFEWKETGSVQVRDPRRNLMAPSNPSDMSDWDPEDTLWTNNVNCTVADLPFVHPNAPMSAIGEIGYVYATGSTGSIDFASAAGASTLDRFAVFPPGTNYAANNRIQANSGYTNVIRLIFEPQAADDAGNTNAFAQPDGLAAAYLAALRQTDGQGWTCFREMMPDVMRAITDAARIETGFDPSPMLVEDLVRALPERVTFRQNIYVIVSAAQRLAPTGKRIADQRAAATVIRDAYTGGWFVHNWFWLSD